jgi:hypothetical protein
VLSDLRDVVAPVARRQLARRGVELRRGLGLAAAPRGERGEEARGARVRFVVVGLRALRGVRRREGRESEGDDA